MRTFVGSSRGRVTRLVSLVTEGVQLQMRSIEPVARIGGSSRLTPAEARSVKELDESLASLLLASLLAPAVYSMHEQVRKSLKTRFQA